MRPDETERNRMDSRGGTLSPRQRKALPLLAAGPTIAAACRRAGIGRSTFFGWRESPAFADALRAAEDAAFREVLADLRRASGEAVAALRGLLASRNEPVRLGACREILGLVLRARELVEFEERLGALENRIGGQRP